MFFCIGKLLYICNIQTAKTTTTMKNLATNKESLNRTLEIYIKASNRTLVEKITEVSEALNISRLEAIQLLADAEERINNRK